MSNIKIKDTLKKCKKLKNQPSILLTIDWLTLNVEDVFQYFDFDNYDLIEKGAFQFEIVRNQRTKHFNQIINLWHDGLKVGSIACKSNNPVMLQNRCHVKWENSIFYDGSFKSIIKDFVSQFNLDTVKISRLDLAVDGVYFHKFLNKFLYGNNYNNNYRRVNDLDNISPWINNRDAIKNKAFDSFYIGQRGSKSDNTSRSYRFGCYYNKSKEILQKGGKKEYILQYWERNGFDLDKDVYRYELRFSSSYIAQVDGFQWSDIFEQEKMQEFLNLGNQSFFEFRYNDAKKISNCTPFEMFEGFKESLYVRIKRVVKDKIRTVKIAVKRLVQETLTGLFSEESDKWENYQIRQAISYVNERYHLGNWFSDKFPYWLKEEKQKARLLNLKIPHHLQNIRAFELAYDHHQIN